MKNRIFCILLAFTMIFCFAACGKDKNGPTGNGGQNKADAYGIHHAVMKIKNYGEVKLELDGDTAPITVKNFVDLANDGFYDGLTFHRSVPGFVLQGGDPDGNGRGGSGKPIKGEFSKNGIENNISHKKGVISMARLGNDMDSATSQFFIVLDDSAIGSLDGGYAAFGRVTEGMDIIEKIVNETPVADSYSGLIDKANQPIIESVKIVD